MLDAVIDRRELKNVVTRVLRFGRTTTPRAAPQPAGQTAPPDAPA
jgi:hypothetical protein